MYLAELHGKLSREQENQEDILTSDVFSFLKYADRRAFLYPFLLLLDLPVSAEDAQNAEFIFWPSFDDHTEPDLVLIVGPYYLLIEAKYHSGFGQETKQRAHQIIREIKGGKNEADAQGKIFKIVALTAHYSEKPEILRKIPEEYRADVIWTNWQTIAAMIYQCLANASLTMETRLFATDLYDLLVRKNLRSYEGIKLLPLFPELLDSNRKWIFLEARSARYRDDFIGFTETLSGFALVIPTKIFLQSRRGPVGALAKVSLTISPTETIFFWRNTHG